MLIFHEIAPKFDIFLKIAFFKILERDRPTPSDEHI